MTCDLIPEVKSKIAHELEFHKLFNLLFPSFFHLEGPDPPFLRRGELSVPRSD